jgi:hypothetical protein
MYRNVNVKYLMYTKNILTIISVFIVNKLQVL